MKDAYYFSHDFDSRNDPKMRKLRRKHGAAGVGLFWMIVEMLYEQEGYLPYDVDDLAYDLRESEATIQSVITEFDLFENDGVKFWSRSVLRRLEERRDKIEKARRAGEASARSRRKEKDVEQTFNGRSTIKGKERKEKEIEDGDNAPPSQPSIPEDKVEQRKAREHEFRESLIPFEATYPPEMVEAFYNRWREPDASKTKMRFELEKTWDLELRLQSWAQKELKFNTQPINKQLNDSTGKTDVAAAKLAQRRSKTESEYL